MTAYETANIIIGGLALVLSVGVIGVMVWGIVAMQTQMRQAATQAADDRNVTHGLLAALKTSVDALKDVIGRTAAVEAELQRFKGDGSPQGRPGPAE